MNPGDTVLVTGRGTSQWRGAFGTVTNVSGGCCDVTFPHPGLWDTQFLFEELQLVFATAASAPPLAGAAVGDTERGEE